MLLDLPGGLIVVLNFGVIPFCHLLPSWALTRMPGKRFRPAACLFQERNWERGGAIYEHLFAIRRWKDFLPDGASWLGGFPKKSLVGRDVHYLCAFRVETCRGELSHYLQIPLVLVTLLWNPWPYAAVIILYALLSNVPCILVQRHTRHRLARLLTQRGRRTSQPDS